MPYLGDYLGQLLSEISMARMQADLETVRLAELYATHPLLKLMPVPHVRLPDVELDIPVLIQKSEEPRSGESGRGGIAQKELRKKFDEVLDTHLLKSNIKLSAEKRKLLSTELDKRLKRNDLPMEISTDVYRLADDLTDTALKLIDEMQMKTPKDTKSTSASTTLDVDELKNLSRLEFLKMRSLPPRLMVAVTNSEVREGGTSETMTKLHLKITEQGLEWKSIQSEGTSQERLLPE